MKFGAWYVWRLCRSGSLTAVARELARYRLDFLTAYCAGGKIEKNEIGEACGAYGGGERGV